MLYTRLVGLLAVAASCCAQTPVILISIDTLRADRVGPRTPNLTAIGSGGTVFTAAEAQYPITLPSHTSLLTSTFPFRNGVEENAGHVPASLPTLASVLRDHGYKTGAFIGSIFLEKQLGLDRGFDTYDSPFEFEAFSKLSGQMLFAGAGNNPYAVRERRAGALVLRAASQWLSERRGQPVFAFVHLFDAHKPYRLGSYEAEIQNIDKLLGGFVNTLKREGWWDRSLVIVTSDHGEGLGEHGESDHGYFVYESTLHVPLIAHWPAGVRTPGARVTQPVGLIDVAPTILEALKVPKPATFEGHSVLSGSAEPVVSESTYGRDCFGWAPLRAVRLGSLKYIDAPKPELYDLATDPRELTNLVKARPGDAARLKAELIRMFGQEPALSPPPSSGRSADPQRERARLESLGYLGAGPRARSAGAAADPKDKLPELLAYEDALNAMEARRYDTAIAMFRRILASDPGNLLARRDLGVALIEKKAFRDATEELRKVAAASVEDYLTRYELGIAEEGLEHYRAAQDQFEAACRIAPAAEQCRKAIERVRSK